jgi:hypothetical protein
MNLSGLFIVYNGIDENAPSAMQTFLLWKLEWPQISVYYTDIQKYLDSTSASK